MKEKIRAATRDRDLVSQRRKQIAEGAAHVFVKKGYEHTSVQEIAEACGMSKGSLYNYVGSKEDILYLVIGHALNVILDVTNSISKESTVISATEAIRRAFRQMCELMDEIQDIIVFIYQETKNLKPSARESCLSMQSRYMMTFENILAKGCATGDFFIDDITMAAYDIVMDTQMWAFSRWFLAKRYTLDEYIREQTELILRAIRGNKAVASEGR